MKTNVLIFPAGEINSIELHEALSHNVNIEVYGASSVDRHGSYVFKNYKCDLPLINEPDFIERFNRLLNEWHIDFIFPTHDSIALFLIKNKNQINAVVLASDLETALVCRNKRKTYELFQSYDFCPKIYSCFSEFPCFIKPIDGQGAKGAKLIQTEKDIPRDFSFEENVITEYLPGDEITVDCLTDNHGKLRAILPRSRKRLMAGVCVSGDAICVTQEILRIAECINDNLKFFGLWYFQLKKDSNKNYKLLEISTRCSGTMCLSRARGVNLPLLSVYMALNKPVSVIENCYNVTVDRTLISRYKIDYDYNIVYIDYDDTIIENDEVNLNVIRYLYQCKNNAIKVILISRHNDLHEDTINESLTKHAISEKLFDEIINIKCNEEKAQFIKPHKAIFIDNSYLERKKIHDALKLPVFDNEGIEVLTDWRS